MYYTVSLAIKVVRFKMSFSSPGDVLFVSILMARLKHNARSSQRTATNVAGPVHEDCIEAWNMFKNHTQDLEDVMDQLDIEGTEEVAVDEPMEADV